MFATRLTDRTSARGTRVRLTCLVTGNPEPQIKWFRDGLPLTIKGKIN